MKTRSNWRNGIMDCWILTSLFSTPELSLISLLQRERLIKVRVISFFNSVCQLERWFRILKVKLILPISPSLFKRRAGISLLSKLAISVLFSLLLAFPSFAQNSRVSWYSFSSGFSTSVTGNTICVSSIGESFIGKNSNGSSTIISGFLTYNSTDITGGSEIPNLPIPIGTGSAEVWGDSIYYFGGSNHWSGSTRYPRIYKFDGVSWIYYDSIPDYTVWGLETILVGSDVYLLGGYPGGASLFRKYNLITKEWNYLTGPNLNTQHYGLTSEYYNGKIFLFSNTGLVSKVFAYDIPGESWEIKTPNSATGIYANIKSILYNNEIYLSGWNNSEFYKYTPSADQWTQLANSPYPVFACAMGVINNLIFCVGGNNGSTYALYNSAIVYNVTDNSWTVDSSVISSNRDWMASVKFQNNFYVLGGLGPVGSAVDIVEKIVLGGAVGVEDEKEIIPTVFKINQNYPNPFNPSTVISWQLPVNSHVLIKVYDILGREIKTLVDENKEAGYYKINFDGSSLASGVYIYRLTAGTFNSTKKMLLVK